MMIFIIILIVIVVICLIIYFLLNTTRKVIGLAFPIIAFVAIISITLVMFVPHINMFSVPGLMPYYKGQAIKSIENVNLDEPNNSIAEQLLDTTVYLNGYTECINVMPFGLYKSQLPIIQSVRKGEENIYNELMSDKNISKDIIRNELSNYAQSLKEEKPINGNL